MRTHRVAVWIALLLTYSLTLAACGTERQTAGQDPADETDDTGESQGGQTGEPAGEEDVSYPDPGISDDSVSFGATTALSGPLSVFGNFQASIEAYFASVNEAEGGVDGRELRYTFYDDGFEPSRSLENVRRLVEQDEVFGLVGTLGTAPNLAIWDYANENDVPHLYLGAGTSVFGATPDQRPWTIPYLVPYPFESAIFARYLEDTMPDATVAVLRQAGDLGEDYLDGFTEAIEGTGIEVVADQTYETTDSTVDSQMVNLEQSDADVFFNIAYPTFAAQAIGFLGNSDWDPTHYLVSFSSSIESTLTPAGLENSQGILSAQYLKDPADPTWEDEPAVQDYLEQMETLAPDVNAFDVNTAVSGWVVGQMTVETLRRMEEPSRQGLIDAAHQMEDVEIDMLLPGITVTLGPDDHYPLEALQLQRFGGERYELLGDVIQVER